MVAAAVFVLIAVIAFGELASATDRGLPVGIDCEDIYNNRPQYRTLPGFFWIHNQFERVYCGMNYSGSSCKELYHRYPEVRNHPGYYRVQNKWEICNMTQFDLFTTCAGVAGNWKRIARLDVSAGETCPLGWYKPSGYSYCRVPVDKETKPHVCAAALFSTNGMSYNRVCGRVRGYQKGVPGGFAGAHQHQSSIDTSYLDGVSITRGKPREHIWSYAIGATDSGNHPDWNCPCASFPGKSAPHFVGDHYYCESGSGHSFGPSTTYTSDVLWDGIGCSQSKCCTDNIMQPWFYRSLSMTSTDDIEVRICGERDYISGGAAVDFLEIYVE